MASLAFRGVVVRRVYLNTWLCPRPWDSAHLSRAALMPVTAPAPHPRPYLKFAKTDGEFAEISGNKAADFATKMSVVLCCRPPPAARRPLPPPHISHLHRLSSTSLQRPSCHPHTRAHTRTHHDGLHCLRSPCCSTPVALTVAPTAPISCSAVADDGVVALSLAQPSQQGYRGAQPCNHLRHGVLRAAADTHRHAEGKDGECIRCDVNGLTARHPATPLFSRPSCLPIADCAEQQGGGWLGGCEAGAGAGGI